MNGARLEVLKIKTEGRNADKYELIFCHDRNGYLISHIQSILVDDEKKEIRLFM